MRFRALIQDLIGVIAVTQAAVVIMSAQTSPEKPLMSDDVFKNVQVLKGIPVNEFMETMGFFSASLSYNCTDCHVPASLESWAKYAEDIPTKRMARNMIQMVNAFNKANFGGRRVLTCYSCHRGAGIPKNIPSLAEQYSAPIDDANEVEIVDQSPQGPSVEQILDRYIRALGGEQQLAKLTSFAAKGTYVGYDTDSQKVPAEVIGKAPAQRTLIVHGRLGDSTTAFDGRDGWIAGPDKPVPVLKLPAGPDLDALKFDAVLSFPGGINQALSQWRVGFPEITINDRKVEIIQATTDSRSRIKLFFDKESGLLVRSVRFVNTVVGIVPTQVDYSDYREVSGVKMPFRWTVTWTDGRSTVQLDNVQPNVAIDDAKFLKPARPAMPESKPSLR